MTPYERAVREYERDTARLSRESTTSEQTYYPAIRSLLTATLRHLGLPDDIRITVSYFGGARGDWGERQPTGEEPVDPSWGEATGDLYINHVSLNEKDHFRETVQRIAAVLALRNRLDDLYLRASADPWTSDALSRQSRAPAS